jgi:hypothetical protein
MNNETSKHIEQLRKMIKAFKLEIEEISVYIEGLGDRHIGTPVWNEHKDFKKSLHDALLAGLRAIEARDVALQNLNAIVEDAERHADYEDREDGITVGPNLAMRVMTEAKSAIYSLENSIKG